MPEPKQPKHVPVTLISETDDSGQPRLPYVIMREYVAQHHPHLAEAKIALLWRDGWKQDKDGILRLGQARKASDTDYELHGFDFAIILNFEAWNAANFSRAQMEALIDHELTHCQVTLGEDGEIKRDEHGRPVYRVRKHDIEEFREIIARHGLWKQDLEQFAREAMAKLEAAGTLFPESVEDDQPHPHCAASAASAASLAEEQSIIEGENPLTFQSAEHAAKAVHVAEDLQTLATINPDLARSVIQKVLGDTPAAQRMVDAVIGLKPEEIDALVEQAVQLCISRGSVTAETLHRQLSIPIKRALNLFNALVAAGILDAANGSGQCKITAEQWAQRKSHAA